MAKVEVLSVDSQHMALHNGHKHFLLPRRRYRDVKRKYVLLSDIRILACTRSNCLPSWPTLLKGDK